MVASTIDDRGEEAPRMKVTKRNRRAKKRERPIASGLHDVTIVAMDRIDHQLERR
jgi:hypothetical protein